ncbi:hypothetical protein ACFO5K_24080 [Nocardia halotolerans]|uniref:Uncharacterized protein n=1 Tax=Nocardia halotolerans TaxID=1755878 RepID=A0ABV8VP75_9NOCA
MSQPLRERCRKRAAAAQQEAHAMKIATATARKLAADGVPVRDIGAVLGVTFQRASQLANSCSVAIRRSWSPTIHTLPAP